MKPTERLSNEHRVIETVLACLAHIAAETRRAGRLNVEEARATIEFLQDFADRLHHGKEEDELFALMEARGYPRNAGPVYVMVHEHNQGRAHVGAMEAAAEEAGRGTPTAVAAFVDHALAFVRLLKDHIHKEDHCMFRMAREAMREGDERALAGRFDKIEVEARGRGVHARCLHIARDLCARHGVDTAPIDVYDEACRAAEAL